MRWGTGFFLGLREGQHRELPVGAGKPGGDAEGLVLVPGAAFAIPAVFTLP